MEYEVNEIRSAALLPGEDEELSSRYKILANANAISAGLQAVYQYTGNDVSCAGDNVSRALKQLIKIVEYDEAIQSFLDQTTAIEGLLNDLNRDLSEYLSNLDNQEEELEEVTRRLDLINHLKSKYGNSLEQIMNTVPNVKKS